MINIGDWIRFMYVYSGCELNNKQAMYLGEDIIDRSDGVRIVNFKVLPIGASKPIIIDRSMIKFMQVIE